MQLLRPLPTTFAQTRLDLHRVASLVVSPARRQVVGRMGLRQTPGGFGTPPFDVDGVTSEVGVDRTELVVRSGGEERRAPITTLTAAGAFVGTSPDIEWAADLDIPAPGDLDRALRIDPEAAQALADWYAFGWSILEEIAAEPASSEASEPQLWPEHFDPAIEIGSADDQQRASYGFSPGDVTKGGEPGAEPLPYVYVGPWFPDARPDSPMWNAASFPGALLRHDAVVAAGASAQEQRAFVLGFLRKGRSLLLGGH